MKKKLSLRIDIPNMPQEEKDRYKDCYTSKFESEIQRGSITPTLFRSRVVKTIDPKIISDMKEENEKQQHQIKKKISLLETTKSKLSSTIQDLVKGEIISERESTGYLKQMKELPLDSFLDNRKNDLSIQLEKLRFFAAEIKSIENIPLFFEEIYSTESELAIRYGINSIDEQSVGELAKNYNKVLENFQSNILRDLEKAKSELASQKGSSKSGSSKASKTDQPTKLLHPLEVALVKKAITKLQSAPENKSILLDIFDKEVSNVIKFDHLDPKTHSIVLHKNDNNTFVIIDPSNSTFSNHIATDLNICFRSGVKLMAPSQEVIIYKPKKPVGSESDHYRDCIDIAVKIAIGLEKLGIPINIEKLMELEAVRKLSNFPRLNKHLPATIIDLPLRIHQASDTYVLDEFDRLAKGIEEQIQSLSSYDNKAGSSEQYATINESQITALNAVNRIPHRNYKDAILLLQQRFNDNIKLFTEYIVATARPSESMQVFELPINLSADILGSMEPSEDNL